MYATIIAYSLVAGRELSIVGNGSRRFVVGGGRRISRTDA